jgi:hypothetical protein
MLQRGKTHGVTLNGAYLARLRKGVPISLAAENMRIDKRTLEKAERPQTIRYDRALLIAKYYKKDLEELLDEPSHPVRTTVSILRSYHDVQEKHFSIAKQARKFLICFGSRARDVQYLNAIEDSLKNYPSLTYSRILFHPPFHQVLQDHLLKVLKIRSPYDRSQGFQTLHLCLYKDFMRQPEINICMNESEANLVLPSMHIPGTYDTSMVLSDSQAIKAWQILANDLYRSGTPIESAEDVLKMGLVPDGFRHV